MNDKGVDKTVNFQHILQNSKIPTNTKGAK